MTFVIPINNQTVYQNNFLSSPVLQKIHSKQIIQQIDYNSAPEALNDAIDKATNEIIIFTHQDIYLPEKWLTDLQNSLNYLEMNDPNWGVLGSYGLDKLGKKWGNIFSTGLGVIGQKSEIPVKIRTLDEIVLILRKSSGLRFDENLPHFHFYGTDICMSAAERGMHCYCIPGFCIHNTNEIFVYPKEFYICYNHIKKRWNKQLPIETSCIKITQFDTEVYIRHLKKIYWKITKKNLKPNYRVDNPQHILTYLECTN